MNNIVALARKSGPSEKASSGLATVPAAEVADLIVAYLEQLGVEYVFGVPGGAIEPMYNALARSERRGGPRSIVARHEAGAAFMADGYARETGKLGVCIATSGPGTTNLLTGLACARDNNVPLLSITGLPALPTFGKGALQESSMTGVDTVTMLRHCTRYSSLVSHADQLERKLVNAVMKAHHVPGGPVNLSIPLDVMRAPAKHSAPAYDLAARLQKKSSLIDEHAVQELLESLQDAPRVVFLIGTACGEAADAIMELVDLTQALFVTTPDAKGLVDPRHPAYRGVFGLGGHASARDLLKSEPDLVIALGTSFGEFASGGWSDALLNSRLVHIDDSEENLMRSPVARLHVHGRIRSVCERVVQSLKDSAAPRARRDAGCATVTSRNPAVSLDAPEAFVSDAAPIKPQRLMRELSDRCPPNTRFLADSGNSMVWSAHYLEKGRHRAEAPLHVVGKEAGRRQESGNWLRVMMEFCPMGWAIGAAIGVARGNTENPVVCITGDGAYLMSGQEITVAAAENLPVVFVVLNDGALGMVKHGQRLAQAEQVGFVLPQIDYRKLAEAMGIPGYVIESPEDFDRIDFDAILKREGPTLLDVRIDGEEVPPMRLRMETLGTLK